MSNIGHLSTVWPDKIRHMSIKVAQKWIHKKLPNNVGDLVKIIVAKGFEWLPKVQKIAKSGHTVRVWHQLPV